MRADGIVRRFDELGRINIPREVRKQLFGTPEKSEGMPMEIFMDKDTIVLCKYEENKADDVCEAKQGKWIFDKFTAKYGNPYRCSCCSEEFGDTYNYCPNCGVRMKEVE